MVERIQIPQHGFRGRIAVVILIFAAARGARRQIDADEPVIVSSTKRSEQLGRMAMRFALDGHMDSAAVVELRSAAGRRRKELRRAAASMRLGGGVNENRSSYIANQLLLSAATGQPLQPITAEHEAKLQRIHELQQGTIADVFARLVALQPALADVARTVQRATVTARH
ncbi:MAG TPA: hypothetical protein VGM75_23845, partial [Pseudonocardiaceae bacterium]